MPRVIGTQDQDTFTGKARRDIYFGEGGNDILKGFGGQDNCNGGFGNDLVDGGSGDDTVNGDAGDDRLFGGAGDDTIEGNAGRDRIDGGSGNDDIDGGSGRDVIFGGIGDDNIRGGTGNDRLSGGDGNDFIAGDTGNDIMVGGQGDDTLDWDDGDGNDIMSGNDGRDTIEVDGALERGDNFVLGKRADNKALFERIGLDGQAVDRFNLVVDTSEVFDVSGEGGNDTFIVNDLTGTGVELILFSGGEGNDLIDARAIGVRVEANGGEGNDTLIGGTGTIVGANGAVTGDTLTGGAGQDDFVFATNPFAGGTPGQNVVRPDVITDYEIGSDQLVFDKQQFGFDAIKFQKGNSNQLSGNNNVLVLTDGFANAGAAAQAIRNNNAITANKGLFVYFNTTLGISRVVHSNDLANGGSFSVVANLTSLTNVNNQANFSAADFSVV